MVDAVESEPAKLCRVVSHQNRNPFHLEDLHGTVSNAEDVVDGELVGVPFVRSQQLRQQINALRVVVAVLLFSLLQLCDGNLGHGGRLHLELLGQVWPNGIVSEYDVEFGDVANDAVVPLHVIDVLDRAFNVDLLLQEAKLS